MWAEVDRFQTVWNHALTEIVYIEIAPVDALLSRASIIVNPCIQKCLSKKEMLVDSRLSRASIIVNPCIVSVSKKEMLIDTFVRYCYFGFDLSYATSLMPT